MTPSYKAIQLIQYRENCKLTAYKDSQGYWTIGWGHQILPTEKHMLTSGFKLSQSQADKLHEKDIAQKTKDVNSYLKVRVSQNMFDALVSFAYNYSPKWVTPITRAINSGSPVEHVSKMFMERGTYDRFLQKCRYAEVLLMIKGVVTDPQKIRL